MQILWSVWVCAQCTHDLLCEYSRQLDWRDLPKGEKGGEEGRRDNENVCVWGGGE